MTSSARPTPATLEQWLGAFRTSDGAFDGPAKVMPVDEAIDDDAVIVIVPLQHAPASIYLELDAHARWNATLTARDDALTGPSLDLVGLGTEVAAAGRLRAYLQDRTDSRVG